MTKEYSNKYFLNKIRTHRLAISKLPGYKPIEELLLNNQEVSSADFVNLPQNQGRDE